MDFTLAYYYANLIHFIFSEATADSIPIGAYLCWMRGAGLDMQARIQGGENTGRPDDLPVLYWGGLPKNRPDVLLHLCTCCKRIVTCYNKFMK